MGNVLIAGDLVRCGVRHRLHPRPATRIAEHHFTFAAESEALLESVLERFMLKAHRGGG